MKSKKIYIAGHRGLIGSALVRELRKNGYSNIIGRTHSELDLLDTGATRSVLETEKPDVVIVAAALVGGIHANNTFRSEFIFNNLQIQNNLIWNSHELGINQLIFLGSSCIYPRQAPQPMIEQHLLTGPLEYTNRPYALAKIAGLELVNSIRLQYQRNYFSVMPTNLYGPGDNFHPENSHVLPALIRRFVQAKKEKAATVTIWGSGTPRREFLHVDDCASAIVHLMEKVKLGTLETLPAAREGWFHVNIGSGSDVSIADLAACVSEAVGFEGKLIFDTSKPDGTPRKLMDNAVLRGFGWRPEKSLSQGVSETVKWYINALESGENGLRL